MSLVISDTSPIRALEWVELLDLLPTLFGRVLVPPAVAAELQRRSIDIADHSFIEVSVPSASITNKG